MNYYEILEVTKDATLHEIKKSYKKLALINHPDKNPNNAEKLEKFKMINEAFTILGDENKRRQYDIFGKEKMKINIYNPKIIKIEMTLEDLYNEIDKNINFERKIYCSNCTLNVKICKQCKGVGIITVHLNHGIFKIPQNIKCKCHNGKNISGNCKNCNDKGYKIINENINLKYYYDNLSYTDKLNLVIPDLGDFGEDLIIQIKEKEHLFFKRSCENLIMDLEINIEESLKLRKKIKLINNKEICIKNNNFIRHGDIYLLSGYGLKKGNLFINFLINFNSIKVDREKIINHLNKKEDNFTFLEIQYFKNKIDILNIQEEKSEFINECNQQ